MHQAREVIFALIARAGSNVFIVVTIALIVLYWQQEVTGAGPLWKDVAFGALSIAGIVGAVAFRMFMKGMKDVKDAVTLEIKKRDQQHQNNQKILLQLIEAIKTGDPKHLNIKDLFYHD
jgi:hypothetical protein